MAEIFEKFYREVLSPSERALWDRMTPERRVHYYNWRVLRSRGRQGRKA